MDDIFEDLKNKDYLELLKSIPDGYKKKAYNLFIKECKNANALLSPLFSVLTNDEFNIESDEQKLVIGLILFKYYNYKVDINAKNKKCFAKAFPTFFNEHFDCLLTKIMFYNIGYPIVRENGNYLPINIKNLSLLIDEKDVFWDRYNSLNKLRNSLNSSFFFLKNLLMDKSKLDVFELEPAQYSRPRTSVTILVSGLTSQDSDKTYEWNKFLKDDSLYYYVKWV